MEEKQYKLECDVCGVSIELTVFDEQELPTHCPMCGSEQSSEWSGPLYN